MRIKVAEYRINPEESSYVQMLHYEMDGLRVLYTQLLQAGTAPSEIEHIKDEYIKAYNKWRLAFNEVTSKYNTEFFDEKYVAELNFHAETLYIYEEAH